MWSSRTCERWTMLAALFVLISQILLLSAPARAVVGPEALLEPTPLVLKDGRIANVSIHTLPFDHGQGDLAGPAASRLAELTATVATDCFLTAQVIGHVSSREVAENETLAAHRLARARADAVQASLIGGGLPAKSIASVWDWQFLVREPRVTLWLFRLVQGEDCEGLPLEGGAPLVAGNDAGKPAGPQTTAAVASPPARAVAQAPDAPRPATPAPRAESREATSGPDLAGVVSSAPPAESTPPPARAEVAAAAPKSGTPVPSTEQDKTRSAAAPQAQVPQRAAASPQASSAASARAADQAERAALPPASAADAVPTVTRPLPAPDPAQVAKTERPPDAVLAAVAPRPATAGGTERTAAATRQSVAPASSEREGKVEWGQDNVVITFATNSSYFPPGTTRRLSALIQNLHGGDRYRVRLEVGVSGSDTVVGAATPEEARRYNRWLAERRLSRVREWLDENAGDRALEIEPIFQADDSSRRVVVRVAPVS